LILLTSPPSERQTDNIIQLVNSYNIDQTASEHLFDGSIIQNGGADIWDGLVVIANRGMNLQIIQDGAAEINDFWNYGIKGSHTGTTSPTVLTDSTKSWVENELLGLYIENITDGSWGVITANTATTATVMALYEGTDNDWDTSDEYQIVVGLNADATAGYSHRFMFKVRTSGTDVDGRRIIGQTRVWGKTYSEFKIGTGTSRGNNVLALTYADDNNNQTLVTSVGTWSDITNTTEGYNAIDVDANGVDEFYWSEWNVNKPTRSINDFYQRMKYLTRQDTTETLYGLDGELFRGVTHQVEYGTLPNSIILNERASDIDDAYKGQIVFIRSGTGQDQACKINSYNGTTKEAIITKTWGTAPDTTSAYVILPSGMFSEEYIARAVWNAQTSSFVENNSFGAFIQKKVLTVAKFLGLK